MVTRRNGLQQEHPVLKVLSWHHHGETDGNHFGISQTAIDIPLRVLNLHTNNKKGKDHEQWEAPHYSKVGFLIFNLKHKVDLKLVGMLSLIQISHKLPSMDIDSEGKLPCFGIDMNIA